MRDDRPDPRVLWNETTLELGEGVTLAADIVRPATADPIATVVFAHGSGSSRKSPRNRSVATFLGAAGFTAVLLDLLTPSEEIEDLRTREHRFDIAKLSYRYTASVGHFNRKTSVPVGCFGASTGAAAALVAAARLPEAVGAVVSRGGRPDLAGEALSSVTAPTLLIVGELDRQVLELNERSAAAIEGPTRIEVVAGATHLFEEPGALDIVAEHARSWFLDHLAPEAESPTHRQPSS
jgi:pimeloyl-ACP methyl ester carboxylesterase